MTKNEFITYAKEESTYTFDNEAVGEDGGE